MTSIPFPLLLGAIAMSLAVIALIMIIVYRNRRHMREHTKMTEEINRQNELLKAVNNVSSILLYPDMEHFEDILLKSMSIMGNVVDVDRVCIWKNHKKDGRHYCSLIYEWVSENRPKLDRDYTTDVSYDDVLHGWWETLSQGKCINSLVRNMSADERAQLNPQKVLSIFITPVFMYDEFWGYVGYDGCLKERIFSDNEIIILRSAGMMFANAFIRNDITKSIVDASLELVRAKDQAEKSNRSKSIFLSQMSHEIRTPMNAILGIADIRLRSGALSPENEEAFGKIYEAGDLLLNIINDILDLSKIESGKLELVLSKYDVPSLINDAAQLNSMRYDSKTINLSVQVDENTPVELLGDELRIKQILNNILSNAFKYTQAGIIEFAVSAELVRKRLHESESAAVEMSGETASPDDGITLVFRISDSGQGMTKNQLERLFDEYSRFNLKTNRTVVGVGLGMNITKRLIKLMNGDITVQSEPGKGSVFTVRIPQKRVSREVCGHEAAEKLRSFRFKSNVITKMTQFIREYMPYGSVLVVDDVESNVYVIRGMLMPYGLKIDIASSGFEAIKKIDEGNQYDIVFMDHMMPTMDGIEATKILRNMGYTNTIVALTADALIGRAEMFLENGFDGFISKPVDSRELNSMLNEFIRNKKPSEVVEAARREIPRKKNSLSDTGNSVENAGNAAGIAAKLKQKPSLSDELVIAAIHDIENAIAVLEEFTQEVDAGGADIELFTATVHGIKSALANIGEAQLSNAALELEQAGYNGELNVISAGVNGFMDTLKSLLEKIKPRETNDNNEISNDDMDFLRDKLEKIKTSCEKLIINDAKTALAGLRQKKWPRKVSNAIDEISLFLLRGEYSKAMSAAEKAESIVQKKH